MKEAKLMTVLTAKLVESREGYLITLEDVALPIIVTRGTRLIIDVDHQGHVVVRFEQGITE